MTNTWGSDVPISMPIPPKVKVEISMFGFGMSRYGICHDLTEQDYLNNRTPTYAPDINPGDVSYDDEGLDN